MTFRRGPAALLLALAVTAGVGIGGPAYAAGPVKFKNCDTMHAAAFINGVAKSGASAVRPSPRWVKIKTPAVDSALYSANKKLDRDSDGIACEVAT
jgi:Excalibur calcium-binding domain